MSTLDHIERFESTTRLGEWSKVAGQNANAQFRTRSNYVLAGSESGSEAVRRIAMDTALASPFATTVVYYVGHHTVNP